MNFDAQTMDFDGDDVRGNALCSQFPLSCRHSATRRKVHLTLGELPSHQHIIRKSHPGATADISNPSRKNFEQRKKPFGRKNVLLKKKAGKGKIL